MQFIKAPTSRNTDRLTFVAKQMFSHVGLTVSIVECFRSKNRLLKVLNLKRRYQNLMHESLQQLFH